MSSTLNYNRVIINRIVWQEEERLFISKKSLKSPPTEHFTRYLGGDKNIVTGGSNGCDWGVFYLPVAISPLTVWP